MKGLRERAARAIGTLSPPRGTVCSFAGDELPDGWHWCDGTAISREEFPNTFQLLGTKFGSGDGVTTFNLPKLPDLAPGVRYIIKTIGRGASERE